MIQFKENQWAKIIALIYFLIGTCIIATFDGTGDMGDSIVHYFYARYAFVHPEHLFNHWAKPLFTLVATSFAQFGFVGIKFFNLLNASLTLWLTFKIAQKLALPNPLLSMLILATCSGFFTLTFSGLTEYFAATLLCWSIYLLLTKGGIWAAIIVSFLPFVRSEGLLFVGVIGLYFLINKQGKLLPLLAIGHIVYAILGGMTVHEGNFLWIFNKMSYATFNAYGHGSWFHFVDKLYYFSGLPQCILFWLGVLSLPILFRKPPPQYKPLFLLVFGSFFIMLVAHSLFWYFGVFMSMGLIRVMNVVMPLFALIALCGFNVWQGYLKNNKLRYALNALIITCLLVFPFTKNPAAFMPQKTLGLYSDQILADEIAAQLRRDYPDHIYYLMHPQIVLTLGLDYFDTNYVRDFNKYWRQPLPEKSILIWDSRFCITDGGIQLAEVEQDTRLEKLTTYQTTDGWQFVIFKPK